MTVDDEDSKIVVFDNWKQVSELPALPGTLLIWVLLICDSAVNSRLGL